jgi:hypothetical protein
VVGVTAVARKTANAFLFYKLLRKIHWHGDLG